MKDWFTAHKDGLRQVNERLIQRRGYGLIGGELYQNVMDTDATVCRFQITKVPGMPRILINVEDNGPGFARLSDAWTMFAPSEKKDDPEKAGRFNLGEKVVLSFAYEATIHTTSGTVTFSDRGRETHPRRKRESGTMFEAELACTAERYEELIAYMRRIIVRPGLQLFVNNEEIEHRDPIMTWTESLRTEIGDDLRPTSRRTTVEVFEPFEDELPMLYELGIPVVETGDRWHVSIGQKVPLNSDRDNVTPAYLRSVRVSVVNNMHEELTEEDTTSTWVNEATEDDRCDDEAVNTFRVKKYGEKSVASDPTNPEADAAAMAAGYVIIPSRGLSRGQRDNLYRGENLTTSSKEFPTAGKGAYSDDPDAKPVKVYSESEMTDGMKRVRDYAEGVGRRLLGREIEVRMVYCKNFVGKRWGAAYGGGVLDFNVFVLGKQWFEFIGERTDKTLIHELGHEYESNHLCDGYHDALCKLGAALAAEMLRDPKWFKKFRGKDTSE
jgi:hypothetical protein